MPAITKTLDGTFVHWRTIARQCLTQNLPPHHITWTDPHSAATLFPASPTDQPQTAPPQLHPPGKAPAFLPAVFLTLARTVSHARDADRWNLLYTALYRLTHDEPHLLDLATDDLVLRLTALEKSVRRDAHKTKAFIRFRAVSPPSSPPSASPIQLHYIAFHRPDHYILPLVADFFQNRFSSMHFTILTPDQSLTWDGHALHFGPGVPESHAPPPDQMEALWKTYYRSIFNPARIKINAMKKELPVRHWPTLPETAIIPDLLAEAPARVQTMLAHAPHEGAGPFVPATHSLPQLRQAASACKGCNLCERATQTIFGEGPPNAPVLLLGEQPGDQEDLAGRPFVGPAGQLLNEALLQANLPREQLYLTNAVKHFKWEPPPPGHRGATARLHKTPSWREVVACRPWLMAELEALQPRIVVALGATAAQALLGPQARVHQLRGRPLPLPKHPNTTVLVTVHPAMILRIPDPARREEERTAFIRDLRQVHALCPTQNGATC